MSLQVMSFGSPETAVDLVIGVVPFEDLLDAIRERDGELDTDSIHATRCRYDFVVFGNDESVYLNVTPTSAGAKQVTAVYYEEVPEQGTYEIPVAEDVVLPPAEAGA